MGVPGKVNKAFKRQPTRYVAQRCSSWMADRGRRLSAGRLSSERRGAQAWSHISEPGVSCGGVWGWGSHGRANGCGWKAAGPGWTQCRWKSLRGTAPRCLGQAPAAQHSSGPCGSTGALLMVVLQLSGGAWLMVLDCTAMSARLHAVSCSYTTACVGVCRALELFHSLASLRLMPWRNAVRIRCVYLLSSRARQGSVAVRRLCAATLSVAVLGGDTEAFRVGNMGWPKRSSPSLEGWVVDRGAGSLTSACT